jgi:hypothetical protein
MVKPCACGGKPELRRNPANNGVAYQCSDCNEVLSHWLPHSQLQDVNVLTLPLWDRTFKRPGQGSLL